MMGPRMTRGGFLKTAGVTAAGLGAAAAGLGRVARAETQPSEPWSEKTLKKVQQRGQLRAACSTNSAAWGYVPGHTPGTNSPPINATGYGIDYARFVAAMIFGNEVSDLNQLDATKILIIDPTAGGYASNFEALSDGYSDAFIGNWTHTHTRDATFGVQWGPVYFYDGMSFLYHKDSVIETLEDLNGKTISSTPAITAYGILKDLQNQGYDITIKDTCEEGETYNVSAAMGYPLEKGQQFYHAWNALEALAKGYAEASATDLGALATWSWLLTQPWTWGLDPDDHVISSISPLLSIEPLAPVVREGDSNWHDVLNWAVYASFVAARWGINSGNVDYEKANSTNPEVLRLLGEEPGDDGNYLGEQLGLHKDCFYYAIKLVGNWDEIFDRSIPPNTPFTKGGYNDLAERGGLHVSRPFK